MMNMCYASFFRFKFKIMKREYHLNLKKQLEDCTQHKRSPSLHPPIIFLSDDDDGGLI
jgi:hypothetical protein